MRGRVAKSLSELVRFKTENPVSNYDIQLYLREELQNSGVRVELHNPGNKAVALTSYFGSGRRGLILYGHVDVVPAGDMGKWHYPPFSGRRVGDRIYGRGAADMKAGVTALLHAYKLLYENEIELGGKLEFVSVLDEENWHKTPIGKGTSDWLLATHRLTGEACVMGEPSGTSNICIGERGDLWIKLTSRGTPGHGSSPVYKENACVKLFKCIGEINQSTGNRIKPPNEIRSIVNRSYEVIGQSAKLLEHYSMNVGVVRGGPMINIIPEICEAEIAFCIPHGSTWQKLDGNIRKILKKPKYKGITLHPAFPEEPQTNPTYTSPKSKITEALRSAAKTIQGSQPRLFISESTSDANIFRRHGVDTCVYGPNAIQPEFIHGYNESASIRDTILALKVYLLTAANYLGIKS
jgi:succinyl-diaminopimelate desuccinylase